MSFTKVWMKNAVWSLGSSSSNLLQFFSLLVLLLGVSGCQVTTLDVEPVLGPPYIQVAIEARSDGSLNTNLYVNTANRETYLTGFAVVVGPYGDVVADTNIPPLYIVQSKSGLLQGYTIAYGSPTLSQRLRVPFSDYPELQNATSGEGVVVYSYANAYLLYSAPSNVERVP